MLNFRKINRVGPEKTALQAIWAQFGVFLTHMSGQKKTQKCQNLIQQLEVAKKRYHGKWNQLSSVVCDL